MSRELLNLLGLAKKAGKLEIGEEPVGACARAGQAKLILVAEDAADNTARRASHFAEAGRVKWLKTPFTKADLGGVLGRTSCAMCALTDTGFAASLVSRLAKKDPERYAEAARELDTKAQKILQRQKEQRAHEKNLREGRKKPWNPPPHKPKAEAPVLTVKPKLAPKGKITIKKK